MSRPRRRVTTAPVPGADPTPQRIPARAGEPERINAVLAAEDRSDSWGDAEVVFDDDTTVVRRDEASGSNDAALIENVPPHNVNV
ncbi:hypothetical protein EG850_03950 [Gulosibacter macacae]|uniref:Uncharacterized protein n=1 Tax=Gulosibacter macacae TaxID=2488791 RepID=A0A3P3W3Q9_9MICO|nr:hypothetical protein [Gulosibacter macacae]RRJ87463.1 hypothetical protein EG850_03950 [Gulosibacter macacae]